MTNEDVPGESGWLLVRREDAAGRYPLGQQVLHVRALPQRGDIDIACSVEDGQGRQLAVVRSMSKVGLLQREAGNLRFWMTDLNGRPLAYFAQLVGGGIRETLGVSDASGREVGRLRRTNSWWQRIRSSAMDVSLECGSQIMGRTRMAVSPRQRFAKVDEPIYDATGAVVATVKRKWRYVDTSAAFYDYSLECIRPTAGPLPELLVGTVFGHYLYDRLEVGGPFASHSNMR